MAIQYKINVLAALKNAGYSSYKIRKDALINQAALTRLRAGKMIAWDQLGKVCSLLNSQPGDLLEYVPDTHPEGICVSADPAQEPPKIPTKT